MSTPADNGLDFSRAVPLGSTDLDFSKAVSLNGPAAGPAAPAGPPSPPANPDEPFAIPDDQKGGLAGFKRTVSAFAGLPKNLYHAVFDSARDEDEQTRADATADALSAVHHIPMSSHLAMILNRMVIEPMIEQSDKADAYKRIAEGRHAQAPAEWESETGVKKAVDYALGEYSSDDKANDFNHRANMHRIASLIPLLGPAAGEMMEHYNQGDKSGMIAELLANIAGARISDAAGGAAVRGIAKGAGNVAGKIAPQVRDIAGEPVPVLASQRGSGAGRAVEGAAKLTGISGEHMLNKFVRGQDESAQAAMGNMARNTAGRTADALDASAGELGSEAEDAATRSIHPLAMEPEDLQKLTDTHDALRQADSFGDAAEKMQNAAAAHFQLLDVATDGEFSALRTKRSALYKALRNPMTDAGKITEELSKIADQEDEAFDNVGIGDSGRSVLDTARHAWKKSLALQELDSRIARASQESFGPQGIDGPPNVTTRGSTLLKQLKAMGDDRLNLALENPRYVGDLKRLGALLQDGQNVGKLSLSMRLLRGSRILGAIHHPIAVAGTEAISATLGKLLTDSDAAGYLASALKKGEGAPAIAANIARLWGAKNPPEDKPED